MGDRKLGQKLSMNSGLFTFVILIIWRVDIVVLTEPTLSASDAPVTRRSILVHFVNFWSHKTVEMATTLVNPHPLHPQPLHILSLPRPLTTEEECHSPSNANANINNHLPPLAAIFQIKVFTLHHVPKSTQDTWASLIVSKVNFILSSPVDMI